MKRTRSAPLHAYTLASIPDVLDDHNETKVFGQGAPLAYTPFCDNNKEMDGFRFWKQGFWQDHLKGKPYHISALYVVDLQRFR